MQLGGGLTPTKIHSLTISNMPKTIQQKEIIVANLKKKLGKQKANVFLDFAGVDCKTLFKLRNELKAAQCGLEVVKKTLLKKVLGFLGQQEIYEKVNEVKGQLALAFAFEDEVGSAKICRKIQKENEKLQILGGVFAGKFWEKEKMLELAELLSRQELLGRLVGSLQSPINNFVYVLQGNIKGLITALSAIKW